MTQVPPPPPGAPPPPPPGAPSGGVPTLSGGAGAGKPRWLVPAIVAVVVVALAGIGAFVIFGGSDTAAADIVAESVTDPGADPFMASMAVVEVAEFPSDVQAVIDQNHDELTRTGDVLIALGTQPGLYGGSSDESVCDAETLVAFLEDHPDEAAAWAGVQAIAVDDIADYVATLDAVVLTTDTLVINHGFAEGAATPRDAVLQAGTAVMVDDRGVPRVKCSCGNPLLPPDTRSPNLRNVTGAWEGFDADRVAVVDPGVPSGNLELIDIETGDLFELGDDSGGPGGTSVPEDAILLLPDGIDVYSFGAPGADVAAMLTVAFGEPSHRYTVSGDQDFIGMRWEIEEDLLSVYFKSDALFAWVYESDDPQPGRLMTPEGITPLVAFSSVQDAYPDLEVCDEMIGPRAVAGGYYFMPDDMSGFERDPEASRLHLILAPSLGCGASAPVPH